MEVNDKIIDNILQYDVNSKNSKKSQHYHRIKLIEINILQVKKLYSIKQGNFTYSPLGKDFWKK